MFGNFIFLSLPFFRGYFLYGGADADAFSHIGWIKEIEQSAHIGKSDFYPGIHLFGYSSSEVLNISYNDIVLLMPPFFSTLYLLFMLILSRAIVGYKKKFLLIVLFSFPLIFSGFHRSFHPAFYSLAFLPMLLFFFHKLFKPKFLFLLQFLSLFMIFFHPLTAFFVIIVFLLSELVILLNKNFTANKIIIKCDDLKSAAIILSLLNIFVFLIFIIWCISNKTLLIIMRDIFKGSSIHKNSILRNYLSTLSIADLTPFQLIRLSILKYGGIIIYFMISLYGIFTLIKKHIWKRNMLYLFYTLQLFATFIIGSLMLMMHLIIINPIRAMIPFLIFATIFNGLTFNKLFETKRRNKEKSIMLAATIIFSIIICTFNVYDSPIIWSANKQFTYMNYAGETWTAKYRNLSFQIAQDYGCNIKRIEHYLHGVTAGNKRITSPYFLLPTHFGYNRYESIIETVNMKPTYILVTKFGKTAVNAFPENVKPKVTQYTTKDFNKLYHDHINKIYENKEFEAWCVLIRY